MDKKNLLNRTKRFAIRIIRLSRAIPKSIEGVIIAKQIIRSGTSVASNYRAACRSRSKSDFISKLCIVEEEADETLFWMELLIEADIVKQEQLVDLMEEANQILAIVIKSKITARKNQESEKNS
jgi:four helix bundle protein